jgi:hypothetical protein
MVFFKKKGVRTMDKRRSVRYASELLPKKMTTTTISLKGECVVESVVANYCALGMKVIIPSFPVSAEPPKLNDSVKVLLPADADEDAWFTGICVHAAKEANGSVSLGIFFHDPGEQTHLYKLLFTSLNEPHCAPSFVSHEWEELVAKLCNVDDEEIKKIGNREMDIIKTQQKGNCFRPSCKASAECFFNSR